MFLLHDVCLLVGVGVGQRQPFKLGVLSGLGIRVDSIGSRILSLSSFTVHSSEPIQHQYQVLDYTTWQGAHWSRSRAFVQAQLGQAKVLGVESVHLTNSDEPWHGVEWR